MKVEDLNSSSKMFFLKNLFNFNLNLNDSFTPNPFQRHTTWALTIGSFFTSLTVYGSNQATIQRYMTMKTVSDAQRAMYLNLIGTFSILTITCLTGLIAYAVYHKCDLLTSKRVSKGEQVRK